MKKLFVVAHPDDETIFFGNSIVEFTESGDEVTVVTLTKVEAGYVHREEDVGRVAREKRNLSEEMGIQRKQEFLNACKILGAKQALCLDLPDGNLGIEHLPIITEFIKKLTLDAIYTFEPSGTSVHADHQACFFLVRAALIKLGLDTKLYFVQKPMKLIESMDEWSHVAIDETDLEKHIAKSPDRILDASKSYHDQAKLIKYFKRIGFLVAPEFHIPAKLELEDFREQVRFSDGKVENLYLCELGQYLNSD